MSGCPGIGVAAAEWLIKQDPLLLGSDNWPVEVAPNPDKSISLPVHNIALTVNGVHLLENLVLEDLAKARAYEFAFIMQPLKLQGATGSTWHRRRSAECLLAPHRRLTLLSVVSAEAATLLVRGSDSSDDGRWA